MTMKHHIPAIAAAIIALISTASAEPMVPVPSTGPVAPKPTATFAWDPNPETNIDRYHLYFGTEPGVWTSMVNAGPNTQAEILFPDYGVYYIVATAINNSGQESPKSEELMAEIIWRGPAAPTMPRASGFNVAVEASTDLENWQTIASASNPFGMREFYRLTFPRTP